VSSLGTVIKTNENETKILSPLKLQRALEQEMKILRSTSSSCARCFVRPSGTEDAVRIYAEANNQKDADKLAEATKVFVGLYCGNTGNDANGDENIGIQSKL